MGCLVCVICKSLVAFHLKVLSSQLTRATVHFKTLDEDLHLVWIFFLPFWSFLFSLCKHIVSMVCESLVIAALHAALHQTFRDLASLDRDLASLDRRMYMV